MTVGRSLGDGLEIEGEKIKIGSCYSKISKFTSTEEAELNNIHGEATIKASGRKISCSGFSGKIQADLSCDEIDMQFSQILSESNIGSSKKGAQIKLLFSDDVVTDANFTISSDCSIDSYINELMVYENKKKIFRIDKNDSRGSRSRLTVNATKAKSFEINTMSWVDFFKR